MGLYDISKSLVHSGSKVTERYLAGLDGAGLDASYAGLFERGGGLGPADGGAILGLHLAEYSTSPKGCSLSDPIPSPDGHGPRSLG